MAKQPEIKTTLNAEDKTKTAFASTKKSFEDFQNHAKQSTQSAQQSMQKFGDSVEKSSGVMDSFKGSLMAMGVAGLAGAVKDSVLNFAAVNDEMVKNSRAVGISMESMQALQYSCDRQGVSFDAMYANLKKFSGTMGEFRSGQGGLAKDLAATNPELYEQMLNAKSNEEAFMHATQAIADMPDASQKAVMAQKIFGKSAVELNKFFEAGADGIRELMDEALDYGVVTTEQANQCESFNDGLAKMQYAMKGITNALLAAVVPALISTFEAIAAFIQKNQKLIQNIGKLLGFVLKLAPAILAGVAAYKAMSYAMVLNNKITLILTKGLPLLKAGFSSLGGFKGLFSAIFGGGWIKIIMLVIALLVAAYVKFEGFRNIINKIASNIKEFFMPAIRRICEVFKVIWGYIQKIFGKNKEQLEAMEPPEPPFYALEFPTILLQKLMHFLAIH